MKKVTIIWTISIVVIIVGLTFIGFHIKDDKVSNIMEESIVEKTQKYLNLYVKLYPTLNNEKKITVDELIDAGYNPNLNKDCTGYVIVKNTNMGFTYHAYVKCPDYVTKDYQE